MFSYTAKRILAFLIAGALLIVSLPFIFELDTYAADEPEITAKGAVLYCLNTEKTLYSKNADKRMEPYSMTKLLTAYIICEKMDLKEETTVSGEAASQEGSTMYLKEGEVLTIEELLYGMLLESGNDAAIALAEACSGSVKAFANLMNETAEKLGCKSSHFVNPNGWKDKYHYTTANDFLLISRAAMEQKDVYRIATTKRYKVRATNMSTERDLKTHATLMFTDGSGVVGGKTGYWDYDDCSVSLWYKKNNLNTILVLIGESSTERTEDAAAVLEYGYDTVKGFQAVKTGDSYGKIWIRGGSKTRVGVSAEGDVMAYPASEKKDDYKLKKVKISGLTAPLKAGDEVGEIQVIVNGEVQGKSKLILTDDLSKGLLPSKIFIADWITIVFIILVLLILVLRYINKRKRRKRRRELARARARQDGARAR